MHRVKLEDLHEAAQFVKQRLGLDKKSPPKTAVVLGSGLGHFGEQIKKSSHAAILRFADVPHFSPSTVEGHKGEIVYGMFEDKYPILALNGRLHLYEGLHPQEVVVPTRVFGLLGIKNLILTNAAGAVGDNYQPGQLMLIRDHLNFTGNSPLVGKNCNELGPRFLDLSEAYDKDLRAIAKKAASNANIVMHEGIYACMLGPCYETPAEVRMLKSLGADAVGMSTIYETIAARHMGMRVVAISCLTNMAAGLSSQKITHDEVMDINNQVAGKFGRVLSDIIRDIG